ncbi:MAG: flap structure-specific endonuclease [Candidatus Thermoplasmatota archaeon]|nr:flap structure-specific endonuclease [Candidatus Thermoplasmatota archaeon]
MGCNLRDLANAKPIELKDLAGQRVAVDAFLVAYQFITSIRARGEGQDGGPLKDSQGRPISHLMGFLDRATVMIESGIEPIFVFDGKPHDLKLDTLDERKARKDEAREKWEAAVEAEDWNAAQKLGSQIVSYTREMVAETQQMFDYLGVAWIEAPMEAEGAAAVRCKNGEVVAVASQDWDVLLYGSPIMIRNLMAHGTKKFGRKVTAERIVLSELLEEHDITQEQLVDLGIMIGTDFHPGIKGIGPKTGLKLIKKHGTMEAVCLEKDVELPENLDQIRAIFHEHPIREGALPNAGMADEKNLRKFLQEERGFSENRMTRALNRLKSVGKLRNAGQSSLFDF